LLFVISFISFENKYLTCHYGALCEILYPKRLSPFADLFPNYTKYIIS